jgi:hypothetical protein
MPDLTEVPLTTGFPNGSQGPLGRRNFIASEEMMSLKTAVERIMTEWGRARTERFGNIR